MHVTKIASIFLLAVGYRGYSTVVHLSTGCSEYLESVKSVTRLMIADSLKWTALQLKPPWVSSEEADGAATRRSTGYNKEFNTSYFEGAMCILGIFLLLAALHAAMPVTLHTPTVCQNLNGLLRMVWSG